MSDCKYDDECDPAMRRAGLANCQCDRDRKEELRNPHLSDAINDNIVQSERDGGIWLKDIRKGETITIQTLNTTYTIVKTTEDYTIEGNQEWCPKPTAIRINGSTWGGSMLKVNFVGLNMHLEVWVPSLKQMWTTTPIRSLKVDRIH